MKEENIIKKIKTKEKLKEEEITHMVKGYLNKTISDEVMGAFLLAIKEQGLSFEETFYLTKAMVNTGDILDLSKVKRPVVDKHSTGGVGDKVTLIVSPIVAACGIGVAKMSGRSLGFTGGTIDKLESIKGYKVKLTNEEFINSVNSVGVALISQTGSLAPADKVIYALRDEIGAVESIPLIASSIMSKKIASGASYIVIDLKVGTGAFMKTIESATTLAKYMIEIGKYFNRKVVCILTDMNTPLGFTVGNAIEVEEAIDYFLGKREKRLDNLVRKISEEMVSLGLKITNEEAKEKVDLVISNGLAYHYLKKWITSQGGSIKKSDLPLSKNKIIIKSTKSGYITNIDPLKISKIVFDLGAGRLKKEDEIDRSVGIRLLSNLYDNVEVGTPLIEVYYNKTKPNEKEVLAAFKIESIINDKKDIIISIIK